jgi:hypothetical protein
VYPGGPRNAFGAAVENYGGVGFLDGPGGNVMWGTKAVSDPAHPADPAKTLAQLDSDGDGAINGEELLDPTDVWRRGDANPGDPASVRLAGLKDAAVVIRQVYVSGGAAGALFRHDFVELYNRSRAPVSLAGWSLQFAPPIGNGNFGATESAITELPNVLLQPGQSYLVQEASDGGAGEVLPQADVIDATPAALGDAGGKIALASSQTSLACNGTSAFCSTTASTQIVDLIGYGNANYYEGILAAPALSSGSALTRSRNGCTDINSNGSDFASVPADFTLSAPVPRSGISPNSPCAPVLPTSVPALPRGALALVLLALGAFASRPSSRVSLRRTP